MHNSLRFGDHIKVRRFYGLYSHHGVYVGDNNVLHLTGDPKRGSPMFLCGEGMASVKINDLKEFESGGESLIVKAVKKDMDKSIFMQEVNQLVNKDREYNLVLHNCEHFANKITDNEEKSQQIQSMWYATSLGGFVSMVGVYTFHTLTGSIILPVIFTTMSFLGLQYL